MTKRLTTMLIILAMPLLSACTGGLSASSNVGLALQSMLPAAGIAAVQDLKETNPDGVQKVSGFLRGASVLLNVTAGVLGDAAAPPVAIGVGLARSLLSMSIDKGLAGACADVYNNPGCGAPLATPGE